jgi:iron(III) transport system permease protein
VAIAYFMLALLPLLVLAVRWLVAVLGVDGVAIADAIPSGRTLGLLWNSLAVAVVVAVLATALGTGLAVWLASRGRMRRLVGTLYLVPLLIPPYIHALEWMAVAGRRQLLDRLFSVLPVPTGATFSAYGFWPVVLVLSLALFPIVTLLVRRGLDAVQPELLEAGLLLDTSWHVFCRIVIPLLRPSVVAAAGLVFVLAMVEYGVPSLLQYNVFVMEMYAAFSQHFDPVRAFATVLPLVAAATAILMVSQSRLRSSPLSARPSPVLPADAGTWPIAARVALALCASVWVLAVSVPVVVLLIRTGSPATLVRAASLASGELVRTLGVAAVTGLVAAAIAVPLGLAFLQRMTGFRWLVLTLPLAIPAPLTAVALIYIWNRAVLDWGYGTLALLVLAHLARFLPFAAFAAFSGTRNVDPLLLEAAALPDVAARRRLTRVVLPLLAPTILVTWLVTFVLSLGELGASLLLSPPGQATLSMVVYNLLHYGATEMVSALALILLLAAATVSSGALLLRRQLSRRSA